MTRGGGLALQASVSAPSRTGESQQMPWLPYLGAQLSESLGSSPGGNTRSVKRGVDHSSVLRTRLQKTLSIRKKKQRASVMERRTKRDSATATPHAGDHELIELMGDVERFSQQEHKRAKEEAEEEEEEAEAEEGVHLHSAGSAMPLDTQSPLTDEDRSSSSSSSRRISVARRAGYGFDPHFVMRQGYPPYQHSHPEPADRLPPRLAMLVDHLRSDNPTTVRHAVTGFRKMCSKGDSSTIQVIKHHGIIELLCEQLKRDALPDVQYEAAWGLTNIASECADLLVDIGAVPLLVRLVVGGQADACDQALWVLGNIAHFSERSRDAVLHGGFVGSAVPPFTQALAEQRERMIRVVSPAPLSGGGLAPGQTPSASEPAPLPGNPDLRMNMLRNGTWAFASIMSGKPPPRISEVRPVCWLLAQLLFAEDHEVLTNVCFALEYASSGSEEHVSLFLQLGVMNRVAELCLHPNEDVQASALRIVGNIVCASDLLAQVTLRAGAMEVLKALQTSGNVEVRKDVYLILSNFSAGSRAQVRALLRHVVLGVVQHGLADSAEVRALAVQLLYNVLRHVGEDELEALLRHGLLRNMSDVLQAPDPALNLDALALLQRTLLVAWDRSHSLLDLCLRAFEESGVHPVLERLANEAMRPDVQSRAEELLTNLANAVAVLPANGHR